MNQSNKDTILQRPIITEKAMDKASEGKYTFRVIKDISKPEIKKAIESKFKVKVIKVNIMNYSGKERVKGRTKGRTASWKKAVVTLKEGDKIELFEGV